MKSTGLFPLFPEIKEGDVGIPRFCRIGSTCQELEPCDIVEYGTGYAFPLNRELVDARVFSELSEGVRVKFRVTNLSPRVVSVVIIL